MVHDTHTRRRRLAAGDFHRGNFFDMRHFDEGNYSRGGNMCHTVGGGRGPIPYVIHRYYIFVY